MLAYRVRNIGLISCLSAVTLFQDGDVIMVIDAKVNMTKYRYINVHNTWQNQL